MTLDPEMQAVLDILSAAPAVDVLALSPDEAARRLRVNRPLPPSTPDPSILIADTVVDGPAGEVPVRIYRPADRPATGVLVNCHGGGWVQGSIAADDARCRLLLKASDAVIVSVGYRLAPEHPFPAGLDDCRTALRWAWTQREVLAGSGAKLAIEGSSAGANLAAAAALAEGRDVSVALQVLISPVCDDDFDTPSYVEYGSGFHLTRRMMRWYWDQYAPRPEDRASGLTALLGGAELDRSPPTFVIVAGCDPLRDEGMAYAGRLHQAGVRVRVSLVPGAIHAFPSLAPASVLARRAFDEIGAALRQAFEAD